MLATHGLIAIRPVVIPKGKGLVGLVVKDRRTINLSNGLKHPEYLCIDDVIEDKFKSFCGVPLVSHGNVIGVLVVQSLKARKLSVKNEAYITTLASHIALIVNQLPDELKQSSPKTLYSGISASEGVGIGHAYLCQKDSLNDVQISYCDDPVYEKECWLKLLQKVDSDLTVEKEALGQNISTEIISMFDAYTMLLFDQTLLDKVEFGRIPSD